ncbi:MAG: redoxin domain-containing protein [Phaeodactylibacter sp.]|nr:redoxin domain-containing protein [Phaeodactylibacter sp.]
MRLLLANLLLLLSAASFATVENRLPETRYVVYLFLAEDCIICQQYTPLLNELYREFASRDLEFIGLFPNRFSNTRTIEAFRDKFKVEFPLKTDYFQTKATAMAAKVTPQAVIYDRQLERILYSGRIDNTYYALGQRRRVTTSSELKTALQALQAGAAELPASNEAVGCLIQYHQ